MKIGDAFRILVTGKRETCEACGGEFTCGAVVAGCWCAEVKVPDEVRRDLRQRYQRCLCPACLEKAAAAPAASAR